MPYKKYTTTRDGKTVYAIKNLRTGNITKFSTPEKRETGIRMREMYSFNPTKKRVRVMVRKHSRKLRHKTVDVKQHNRRVEKYGTIKRGKVKFDLYGKQHKFLLARKLPHSIVIIEDGKKKVKRMFPERKVVKRRMLLPGEDEYEEDYPMFGPEDKIRKGTTSEGRYLFNRGEDEW